MRFECTNAEHYVLCNMINMNWTTFCHKKNINSATLHMYHIIYRHGRQMPVLILVLPRRSNYGNLNSRGAGVGGLFN